MKIENIEYSNVFSNVSSSYFQQKDFCEKEYIGNIIIKLYDFLMEDFHEFDFIIYTQTPNREKPVYPFGKSRKKEVVIYLSDESSSIPDEVMNAGVFAVFKNYLPAELPYKNLFHLPLGYMNTTKALPVVPINERKINVFFSGALHFTRMELYKQFTSLKGLPFRVWYWVYRFLKKSFRYNFDSYFPNSYIQFNTQGFKSGMDPQKYTALLYDTKIAICPRGVVSFESFRHYEAMRAGCVVISDPLPQTFFFARAPFVIINDWKDLKAIIKNLLANPQKMEAIHHETLKWWVEVCSEQAVAKYIAEKLQSLSK